MHFYHHFNVCAQLSGNQCESRIEKNCAENINKDMNALLAGPCITLATKLRFCLQHSLHIGIVVFCWAMLGHEYIHRSHNTNFIDHSKSKRMLRVPASVWCIWTCLSNARWPWFSYTHFRIHSFTLISFCSCFFSFQPVHMEANEATKQ